MENLEVGHKDIGFGFTMNEKIPNEIAMEFVALKQFAISVFAMLEPGKRQIIINNLEQVQSPEMQEIVRNLKLIPIE